MTCMVVRKTNWFYFLSPDIVSCPGQCNNVDVSRATVNSLWMWLQNDNYNKGN